MALVPAIAGTAATAAIAAYLNAKYHIVKDVQSIYNIKTAERRVIKAALADRMCLWQYFEEQVFRMPENEQAIWSRNGCYTWRQVYDQTNRYSQFMLSLGIQKRELVGFYLTNTPEMMFAWLGTWGIGTAPAMINYHLNGDALIHCVKLSGSKILLVDWDSECVERIESSRNQLEELGIRIIILDEATRGMINNLEPKKPAAELRSKMSHTFPMALIYTSGSTGFPKAVPFPTGRTLPFANRKQSMIGIRQGPNGDRYYCCMPLYHGTGGVMAVGCMISGTTLCIGKKFSATRFWDDIRDSDSTAFVYVGEAARYLLAQPPSPRDKDNKVRIMFGNGLRPDVWKRFQDRFEIETVAEFFNSSEGVFGLLNVCSGPYFQKAVGHHGLLMRMYYRNFFATAEVDIDSGDLVRDPSTGFGRRTPLETGGEVIVQIQDESIFPGYWKNKNATSKKFIRNLFKKGDLWYRTGDALRRDREGLWYFMDRLGDTFRWKSENVATMEVQQTLGHFPGVSEVAVYGVPVPGFDGKAGCAAIHLNTSQTATPEFLAEFLKYGQDKLPRYAVPVFIRLLTEISPMHNQKQNKIPLKKDGISLDAIYGLGNDAADARAKGKDLVFYWPGALGQPSSGVDKDTYVLLTRQAWDEICGKTKKLHESRL